MLPKAHLTSHSRMFGSRWLTTPLWLSQSLRPFLYSSVYSCHLFLISSASVMSLPILSFIIPIFAWNVPLVSPVFLKRSLAFFILLFCIFALFTEQALLFLLAIWNPAFSWGCLSLSSLPFASLLFSAICKATLDDHFALLHFFFFGMVFFTAFCTVLLTSTYSSLDTLYQI